MALSCIVSGKTPVRPMRIDKEQHHKRVVIYVYMIISFHFVTLCGDVIAFQRILS